MEGKKRSCDKTNIYIYIRVYITIFRSVPLHPVLKSFLTGKKRIEKTLESYIMMPLTLEGAENWVYREDGQKNFLNDK